MTRVAWIGLGVMGSRMARRLVVAGHDLVVWNRTPNRTGSLAAAGARVAASPAAAARAADVVFVMVTDPSAVRDVVLGADGLAAGVGETTIVVDSATTGVHGHREMRRMLPDATALIDAPVLGSLREADEGRLRFFVGGTAAAVAPVTPLLAELGEVALVGSPGTGAAAKLVANFALLSSLAVLGEVIRFAEAVELPAESMWRVLAHTPLAGQAERRRPAVESQEFPARFRLDLARKDCELIGDELGGRHDEFPLADALTRAYRRASAAGLGEYDYTAILSTDLSANATSDRRGGFDDGE